ncbi:MAG: hypothetical protein QOG64_89 [Acidimicrobiaceae bacterium]|nr:hypothetical protein [Acidimicrobiaceae bacterium]
MPHMVIFRDAEGRPGYHQAEGIEDAVRFVEHLRNEQQVSETRIFSMQEVPIEIKSYWRVEVAVPPAAVAEDGPVAEAESDDEVEPDEERVDEPAVTGVGVSGLEVSGVGVSGVGVSGRDVAPQSNGRFGLFGRN